MLIKKETNYLASAVSDGRIAFAYQAIVCAATHKTESYECLLRVVQEDGGLISAAPYIATAQKDGSFEALNLDEIVLAQVVNELKFNSELVLSMNVSNATISSDKWFDQARVLLQSKSIANRLIIEITETCHVPDLWNMQRFIYELHHLGCRVALDGFATGVFSEERMDIWSFRSLGVDMIKIDGERYIKDITHNPKNWKFVKKVVDFAKEHNIITIAEYVSTAEIAHTLRAIGVDCLQGYYYSYPGYKPWIKKS